ncbi:Mg-dependent DNase [Tubulinosema ratisbonensis]|uniref:Mg-dependent DNase n=1 Tax=Tubulinosema ratisbonensis TaxID=291195 RepID=A0A437APX2_9MICR|nr:Mg-dependent DNase [Tubulinosema ratisbonensis]
MLIDIAVNITDKQFEKDYKEILLDCKKEKILPIFIGTDFDSSIRSLELAKEYNTLCYLGIHPTSKGNFNDLIPLFSSKNVLAVGECGLDYDRLNFTTKEYQINNFMTHLKFNAEKYFFHCRNAHKDFIKMARGKKGVVHSFTGTLEEMNELIQNDFYIGINGCIFKTEEGIEVVKKIPLEKLLVETDAPYCKIRKSSPVYEFINYKENEKKWLRKNTPLTVKQVVECISKIKEIKYEVLERITVENTIKCFGEKVEFFMNEFFKE